MKIKTVTVEQAELNDKETEILSKIKSYCQCQFDCNACMFYTIEEGCNMSNIWNNLKKLNIKYEDIK